MSRPLRLLPEARAEYDDAIDWYEARQPGLGQQFVVRIGEVFRRIAANPRVHAKVYHEARKAVVKQFPFVVIYQEDAGEVIVISVFHTSRDPSEWQSRV
jgi:toxin ParE1/3/4